MKRIALLLVLYAGSMHAATEEVTFQQWVDLNASIPIAEDLFVGGDVGLRGSLETQDWSTVYARPTVSYRVSNWLHPAAGFNIVNTSNTLTEDVLEFRLFQDANLRVPNISIVGIGGRVRFEQRFFTYETSESSWYARLRFQVDVKSPELVVGTQEFFAQVAYEAFLPVINPPSDELFMARTRLNFILGHRVYPSWYYELIYILQSSRTSLDEELELLDNVLRLRVFFAPR